jgi:Bacteriophage tail sheath protein
MSITYGRPGVTVSEVLAPRDTGFIANGASRSVLIADLDRGPVAPTTVGSWNEFRQIFGDWSDNSPRTDFGHKRNASVDAAYLYFSNNPVGGVPLTVLRVANRDAVAASGSISDVTGEAVLSVAALAPGSWGNRLRVLLGGQWGAAGPFDPSAYSDADFNTPAEYGTGTLEIVVEFLDRYGVYQVAERFSGLSLDEGDRRYVGYVVNGASSYISVEVGSGRLITTEVREVDLTGGADGTTPADLSETLHALDYFDNALTITYSGHWQSADLGEVISYCNNRGDSFAVIDTPDLGNSVANITDWVLDLNNKSAFGAVYYPPLLVNDPAAGPNNIRRAFAAGGAVLGAFAANDVGYGMWKTPAGTTAGIRGIVSPLYRFTNPQLDQLNALIHPVNPIRVVNGIGPCIMGGRTLDQTHADRYVGVRRSFSYIRNRLAALTEFAVFEVNGPDLWETINIRLSQWLGLYFQQGALRGARESDAFYIRCDSTNNTRNTIAAGEVHIEVGVAIEYPAEFIVIKLTHNQTSVRVD